METAVTVSKKLKKLIRSRARRTGESYCAARNVLLRRNRAALGQRAEVIAIAGMKGGIGRSTLAVLLASEMHSRGERVLLVGVQRADVPFGEPTGSPCSVEYWRTCAERGGFDTPVTIGIRDRMLLSWEFAELVSGYSLVIVDCPKVAEIQYAAMMWADTVLVLCSTSPVVTMSMNDTVALVGLGRRHNPSLASRLVITMEEPRAKSRRIAALCEVVNEFGIEVAAPILRRRAAFMAGLSAGRPLSNYASGSKASIELQSLLAELFPAGRAARPDMWRPSDVLPRIGVLGEEEYLLHKRMGNFYCAYVARVEPRRHLLRRR
ncbi:hypothetical protein DRW03_35635 [Corallococcus sp. H22C18031201]|nr:hypothetical protein DRW03_35635 [Corallococcus sp. H22C18031201]